MSQLPDDAPTCPRHPGQVAFVRCQRCNRPTCPACQRPAAVGIQCVDCVKEGKQSSRAARSVFGGRAANGRPILTIGIIAVCAVIWLAQQVHPSVTGDLAYVPYLSKSEPWRFVTAAFVHSPSSIFHLLFNMYALWICGQYLEPLVGRARYAALYLISAFGGSVGYELLASVPKSQSDFGHMGWVTPTVGASGAVFGLFAAVVVLNRHLGRSAGPMIGLIVINGVLGFIAANVAWQSHLGGLVTGAIAASVIAAARTRSQLLVWAGMATLAVLLAALATWRFASVHILVIGG